MPVPASELTYSITGSGTWTLGNWSYCFVSGFYFHQDGTYDSPIRANAYKSGSTWYLNAQMEFGGTSYVKAACW